MSKSFLLIASTIISINFGCRKKDNCFESKQAFVDVKLNKDTFNINEKIPLNFTVYGNNGCATNPKILITEELGKKFRINSTIEYNGCMCLQYLPSFSLIEYLFINDTGNYQIIYSNLENTKFLNVYIK
ncbi:MAG: hypothetical protein ACK4K9_07070 [Bacteroidia bacterium]